MTQRPTIAELKQSFARRWRIVGADSFGRDYLDLRGEAHLTILSKGEGVMSFGALVAGLDFSFAPGTLFFGWYGSDEMDESTGHGIMELIGTNGADIEFEYSSGDFAVLKAVRITGG